jgi:type IV fimbrial biogenesis protein FimT
VKQRPALGFTLIELMISVSILGILLLLGLPTYRQWIINTRIRSATESIQNGLRVARNEAVQRATAVRFQLTSASSGADWTVCALQLAATTCPATATSSTLQSFAGADGTQGVQVGASTNTGKLPVSASPAAISGGVPGGITFNSLGRPSAFGTSSVLRIDVTDPAPASRRLVTTISAGGLVDMCDPQISFSANSPQGCP